jgi:DMSO/TMAO reductase YedYZ heme-binding membrane subunit
VDPNKKQPLSPEAYEAFHPGPRAEKRLPAREGLINHRVAEDGAAAIPQTTPQASPLGRPGIAPLAGGGVSPLGVHDAASSAAQMARPVPTPFTQPAAPLARPGAALPSRAPIGPLARPDVSGFIVPAATPPSRPGTIPVLGAEAAEAHGVAPNTTGLIRPSSSRPQARVGTVYRGLPMIVKLVGWMGIAVGFGFVIGATGPTAFNRVAAVMAVQPSLLAWYSVRALGILAYLVLACSVLYGLLLSTKILDAIAHRPVSFALHKDLAVVALILGTLHGALLTLDQSFNFTPLSIIVPFESPYAPIAVGIGQLTLYGTAVVTASFYVRRQIGQRAWRILHYVTFLVFIGSSVHGILSGSDSGTPWAFWMYVLTVTAAIFLTVYRIVISIAGHTNKFDAGRVTARGALPPTRGPLDRPGARGGYPWPT